MSLKAMHSYTALQQIGDLLKLPKDTTRIILSFFGAEELVNAYYEFNGQSGFVYLPTANSHNVMTAIKNTIGLPPETYGVVVDLEVDNVVRISYHCFGTEEPINAILETLKTGNVSNQCLHWFSDGNDPEHCIRCGIPYKDDL